MKFIEIRRKISSVFSIALLFSANIMLGQGIAPIPADPAVRSGQLPNGMRWYVAVNPDVQGAADFALVQMTGTETIQSVSAQTIKTIAQESLMSQPLLLSPTVQDFFVSKGCIPGPEGFAQVNENATVFRFRNVNLKLSDTVMDSTLLVLMNMAGRPLGSDDLILKKWFTPADQAIVVAGDVNADVVSSKLQMLSYMIPKSEPVPRKEYQWQDRPGVSAEMSCSAEPGVARVSALWRLERTPRSLMNTIQPAIQEKYMTMAGLIARERIMQHFKDMDRPLASVECRYMGGNGTFGDGEFEVEVTVQTEDADEAVAALADAMSSIASHGVSIVEVERTVLKYADIVAEEEAHGSKGNGEYVNRCVSAFIHNTPLSSRDDVRKFCSSRELSSDVEKKLLGSVASASFVADRNLTLKYASDTLLLTADSLKGIFARSWEMARVRVPEITGVSLVPHLPVAESKVKVKSVRKEALSGGSMLTLSNGMKIIVRNMQSDDRKVYYSLSLNGGTGDVEGLGIDDGKYLSDYLECCRIGGVSGKIFKDVIRRKGMTLSCKVGHSSTKFKGSVPHDGLDHMLRVLLALMNERDRDEDQWGYYLRSEPLRQASGYASGSGSCLSEDFASKAELFFDNLSANVNNGILVLVGSVDEKALKAALSTYAGGFRTTEKAFKRTQVSSRNFTGVEGRRRKGDESCINVSLTAPMALTSDNYYTAAITRMVLRKHLAKTMAGKGIRVNVECECRRFPQESVLMRLSLSEASAEGFAVGTSYHTTDEAVAALKKVFAEMSSIDIDENALASYRYRLERHLQIEKARPEYWVNALNLRYLDGKDFTTGAEERIRNVTAARVRSLLTALGADSKIEYVITGK